MSMVEALWKQALKTFGGRKNGDFKLCQKSFEQLKEIINDVKAEDLKVDKNIIDYVRRQSSPMCVMDIFENRDITIAIFFLKHGVALPMHDHPGMHGLLKVLAGVVKLDSYTIKNPEGIKRRDGEISATKHPSLIVSQNDSACVLTPNEKNLHEITCVEGPAAFIDVLSPPYIVDDFGVGQRPCTYFKRKPLTPESKDPDTVSLVTMKIPEDFYSVRLKYLGPQLG